MKKRKNKVNLQKIKIKIEELIIEFREIDKLIQVLDHNIIKIHSITCLKDRDFILKIQKDLKAVILFKMFSQTETNDQNNKIFLRNNKIPQNLVNSNGNKTLKKQNKTHIF